MKKLIVATMLLMAVTLTAARADFSLYIAEGTLTKAQARAMGEALSMALDPDAGLILEEEAGESLSQRIFAGRAPRIAVLKAEQAALWARAGLLVPLDGCVSEIERIEQALADACVYDERLMLAPLLTQQHVMAVRPERFEAVNMGYLLDSRAHPVWYPSEFVQALDEMALLDSPGMDVWPPQESGSLWLEALLQGVAELDFSDPTTGAYSADVRGLEDALGWMEDMIRAGLITAAEGRADALERFLGKQTAVFPDWTAEESEKYAQEIERGEILLRPYPTLGGGHRHVRDLVVLCAFGTGDELEDQQARSAIAALLEAQLPGAEALQRGIYDDGAACLPLLGAQEYGATLRALVCDAVRAIIAGEADAQQAARRIDRAMKTMGWQQP